LELTCQPLANPYRVAVLRSEVCIVNVTGFFVTLRAFNVFVVADDIAKTNPLLSLLSLCSLHTGIDTWYLILDEVGLRRRMSFNPPHSLHRSSRFLNILMDVELTTSSGSLFQDVTTR